MGRIAPLLVLLAVGCAPTDLSPTLGPTRGYILISLDTLRADRLSAYGYERPTSPFLEELASRSLLFENAIAQYPSTLTSHMSIFTGLYPRQHGVYPPESILSPDIETLPEAFSRAGFRTMGFAEGGYMRGRYGFKRGFEAYASRDRRAPDQMVKTFARGVRFLESLEEDEPFFLFLHTYAPHAPYEPPPGYESLYWDREIPDTFPPTGPLLTEHNNSGELLSDEVLAYYSALYDATLNHVDDVLRDFFARLDALGIGDDVTVVITSDHGEEFQEHGKMNHTQIYHHTLHVPLVLTHPRLGEGRRVPDLVQSVDIAPTLLRLAGIEPTTSLPGRDLVDTALSGAPAERLDAWSESGTNARGLHHQSGERILHLVALGRPGAQSRRVHLFDVVSDPLESGDLAPESSELVDEMVRYLDSVSFDALAEPETRALDPELEEQLRGLGYLD